MTQHIALDCEFTGLHQHSTLISLALCAEDGRSFYAEFTDFDRGQLDDWLRENVLAHCRWVAAPAPQPFTRTQGGSTDCCADRHAVRAALESWLAQWPAIEIWADCPAWDWVLFCELFGGARRIPGQIDYLPRDFATLLASRGLGAHADRDQWRIDKNANQHNALDDAAALMNGLRTLGVAEHPEK